MCTDETQGPKIDMYRWLPHISYISDLNLNLATALILFIYFSTQRKYFVDMFVAEHETCERCLLWFGVCPSCYHFKGCVVLNLCYCRDFQTLVTWTPNRKHKQWRSYVNTEVRTEVWSKLTKIKQICKKRRYTS